MSICATGDIISVTSIHLWLPLVNLQLNIAKINKLGIGHIDEEDEYVNLGVNLGVYKSIVAPSPKTLMKEKGLYALSKICLENVETK